MKIAILAVCASTLVFAATTGVFAGTYDTEMLQRQSKVGALKKEAGTAPNRPATMPSQRTTKGNTNGKADALTDGLLIIRH